MIEWVKFLPMESAIRGMNPFKYEKAMDNQKLSYLSINNQINHFQDVLNRFGHVVFVDSQILSVPQSFFPNVKKVWNEANLSHYATLSDSEMTAKWNMEILNAEPEAAHVFKNFDEIFHSECLTRLITEMIQSGKQQFITSIDWFNFREIEKNPLFASRLRFVIPDTKSGSCLEKKVLVIGATSLLGAALMRILPERFESVRGTGYSKASQFNYDLLDATKEDSVRHYFETHPHPDILIYVSGEANADKAEDEQERAYALNAEAVSLIHKYCPNVKFVYASTEYIFDGKSAPYTSASAPNPINYYGRTKLEGEWLTLKLFENSVSLRLGALYGYNRPFDKKTTVSKMLESINKNEDLRVDEGQIKHPILLDDAVKTLIKLLEQGVTGVFQANGALGYNKVEMAKIAVACLSESHSYKGKIEGFTETGGCPKPINTFMVNIDTPSSFEKGLKTMIQSIASDFRSVTTTHV